SDRAGNPRRRRLPRRVHAQPLHRRGRDVVPGCVHVRRAVAAAAVEHPRVRAVRRVRRPRCRQRRELLLPPVPVRDHGATPELCHRRHAEDRVKSAAAILAALLVCLAMFLAPHHARRSESSTGAFSLYEVFAEMVEAVRSPGDLQSGRAVVFALLSLASIAMFFWPVALIGLIALPAGGENPIVPAILLIGGVCAIVAAGMNFIMMLMSQTSIGFGGGHSNADA